MDARPSRQGLVWAVIFLVLALAGVDLARGPSSALRGWWTGLHETRGDQTRSLLDQFRKHARGR